MKKVGAFCNIYMESDKKTDKSVTSPLAPIAFPSSLYSTNHHGLVVVASSVVVVVAGVVVVVVVVVGVVVVVVGMVVNWS